MTNKWVKIDDDSVRNVWECPVCNEQAKIYPEDYEDIGTPVCDKCEVDMGYLYTEINNG